jgi:hypothetical protein
MSVAGIWRMMVLTGHRPGIHPGPEISFNPGAIPVTVQAAASREHLDHRRLIEVFGDHQRRPAIVVRGHRIGTAGDEQRRNLGLPIGRSVMERCFPNNIPGVDVRSG